MTMGPPGIRTGHVLNSIADRPRRLPTGFRAYRPTRSIEAPKMWRTRGDCVEVVWSPPQAVGLSPRNAVRAHTEELKDDKARRVHPAGPVD